MIEQNILASMSSSSPSTRVVTDNGVWSCRMKVPRSPTLATRTSLVDNANGSLRETTETMDIPLDSTSPRRNGDLADAIQSMAMNGSMDSLELPADPDAQATVTDFLDFTEYLPSDMIRSLTLIGDLDQTYCSASAKVNDLTKTYGQLPNLPLDGRPDPVKLRSEISQTLGEAFEARSLSFEEATRMSANVDRHYNRAKNILEKLQAMAEAYPPSREPSPIPQKSNSPQITRPPKITLRLDGARSTGDRPPLQIRKQRAPRITVPGEVMAPYELDYESYGSVSDSWDSDDDPLTPRHTPGRSLGTNGGRIKLKIPKLPKIKAPKPARAPRPPGVMGTNVHSAVAGISTSNALAKLKPPPENAVLGSADAPWLQLTAWELAKLRKRMKKNAVWNPSDTMIARELKMLGRGIEAYRQAKSKAEAAGEPFEQTVPIQVEGNLGGKTAIAEGAISVDALGSEEIQLSNRGMKLNEAKKLKKENQAKELAKLAAEEAEESARRMAKAAEAMKDIFSPQPTKAAPEEKRTPAKTPGKASHRKRKRESPVIDNDAEKVEREAPNTASKPQLKRSKTETPVPAPPLIVTHSSTPLPAAEPTPSASPPVRPLVLADTATTPAPLLSPKTSSTPILPPTKESKKDIKKSQTTTTSRRRTPAAATPTPAPEALPARRPSSSRGAKAESVEPVSTVAKDRPRRASTAHNTPAPEPRQPSKRAKRPAPGIVTAGIEGSAAVSKRSAAPRKKGSKKQKDGGNEVVDVLDEVDDEGNVIDPDEPRYCLCNRVSFGTMIGCENPDCEKEWFHLECVGLTDIPARTTKWYCPDCRVTLGIGEKGEVNARGKKK